MPIENEIKYLLRHGAFEEALQRGGPFKAIEQHYVGEGCRVRCTKEAWADAQYEFTFKKMTEDGLVEIPAPISKLDYDRLAGTSSGTIRKRRTSFAIDDVKWDVDLFTTDAGLFVIAEPEMPEGMDAPAALPGFVANHLLLELGRDPIWSNQAMSRPERLLEVAVLANA